MMQLYSVFNSFRTINLFLFLIEDDLLAFFLCDEDHNNNKLSRSVNKACILFTITVILCDKSHRDEMPREKSSTKFQIPYIIHIIIIIITFIL